MNLDRSAIQRAAAGWPLMAVATVALLIGGCKDDDQLLDVRSADSFALVGKSLLLFKRADPGSPIGTQPIIGVPDAESLLGIDIRPADGLIYALSNAGKIYTIDPRDGAATLKSSLSADLTDTADGNAAYSGLTGSQFGVDFNPVPDRLRVVSDTGLNLRINVDTGTVITDGAINGAVAGYSAAAYSSNFADACRTTLYAIDAGSDRLMIQSPPNNGTAVAVGPLGVDADAVNGFDIVTDAAGVDTAVAVLRVGGVSALYSISLQTGAAALVGPFTEPGDYAGLALTIPTGDRVQTAGDLVGVTSGNRLVSFTQAAPGKLCTQVQISGLPVGENVVGVDYRPSDGLLYALINASGAGSLYTLDTATGAASNRVAIDLPLVGNHFGMDFNPTGPVALRIVSDTGTNLRIADIATGVATVDLPLNGAGTGASAAAYTNSVPGAATTQLYVIDAGTDRLRLQNPPNAGTLVDVGPLNIDVGGVNAFEIDGRNNLALAALIVGNATTSTLHSINLGTGAASASLGTVGGGQPLVGLTVRPPTTTVLGLTSANDLVRVSLSDATTTPIAPVTGLSGDASLVGIDFRPSTGILYGLGNAGGLYSISPTTAVATKVSTLAANPTDSSDPFTGLSGTAFGMDFNPTGPVALRVVSDSEQNLRVGDITTGATFTDTALVRAPVTHTLSAAAYTNSFPSATATVLYALDTTLEKLVVISPPNNGVVREIGALGADATASSSLEIVGPNTALAVLDGSSRALSTIDLTTGRATAIGIIATANAIIGIAAPASVAIPAPDSTVFAVTSANQLLSFPRNAPANTTTVGTISGLGTGETIVGVDLRPSTGELWVLTNASGVGRLYTVNTTSAAATLASTLAADGSDTSDAYAGLVGSSFAVDFNPTGPVALRIVSNSGQNLRVANPVLGNAFTDTPIGRPTPDVFAAAYTNNFPAPTGVSLSTQLYVIDAATGSLLLQDPPNDGVLKVVGALSAADSFGGVGGFDIAGGDNAVSLAVLNRIVSGTAETASRLYRINLATGAATEIGNGLGSVTLRGLAVQIR